MGIIVREYACRDCGAQFESTLPPAEVDCPSCSSPEPEREFRTAPGMRSPKTAKADSTLKSLAADYGFSDMKNNRGEAVRRAPQGPETPQFAGANPQMMQAMSKLGPNSDSFSPLAPMFRNAGRPHQWNRTPERK
jgi:putative FmdB family regulatory protein